MSTYEERLPVEVARIGQRVQDHDRRFDDVHRDLTAATAAIWQAVEALRARPQVHPIATAIIAALTTTVGVLTTLTVRGG